MAEEKNPSSAKATEGKEEKVQVPEKFKKLVEEIEKLSVLDLAELVKVLEKKFGVSAAAPVAVAAVPAAGAPGAGPEAEEKSVFNIVLNVVGDKKIEVIKVVRDITEKGLKEAKDLVDAAAAGPQVVKENVKKEEAEELKKKFEAAGAKVELK
jgi:large subunit ribosomal protein L7/L12